MSLNLESKIGQRATQVFTDHPRSNRFFFTSDGCAFYERGDAHNHALTGKAKGGGKLSPVVVEVTRDEWQTAMAAAAEAASEPAKPKTAKPKAAKPAAEPAADAASEPVTEPASTLESPDGNG